MSYRLCNIRIPTNRKVYLLNQFKKFSDCFDDTKIKSVEFGKQDIRGGISITLVDIDNCVPRQKFFENKSEMIGFIIGANAFMVKSRLYNDFEEYLQQGRL